METKEADKTNEALQNNEGNHQNAAAESLEPAEEEPRPASVANTVLLGRDLRTALKPPFRTIKSKKPLPKPAKPGMCQICAETRAVAAYAESVKSGRSGAASYVVTKKPKLKIRCLHKFSAGCSERITFMAKPSPRLVANMLEDFGKYLPQYKDIKRENSAQLHMRMNCIVRNGFKTDLFAVAVGARGLPTKELFGLQKSMLAKIHAKLIYAESFNNVTGSTMEKGPFFIMLVQRLQDLIIGETHFAPAQAYDYFVHVRQAARVTRRMRRKRACQVKREALQSDNCSWTRNAVVVFARSIQKRLLHPVQYQLSGGMLRLSNIILEELCCYMHMRTPARCDSRPKYRFMLAIADTIVAWIDQILADANRRVLLIDVEDDDDVEEPTPCSEEFSHPETPPPEVPVEAEGAAVNTAGDESAPTAPSEPAPAPAPVPPQQS